MPIVPGGRCIPLTFHNRLDYVERAIYHRLHEMDLQVSIPDEFKKKTFLRVEPEKFIVDMSFESQPLCFGW